MAPRRGTVKPAVGMTNPQGLEGKACQWCDAPATQIVTVRPARVVNHEIIEQPITATACATHAPLAEEDPDHPDACRRKHAKGYKQPSLLDVDGGPQSAIFKDVA